MTNFGEVLKSLRIKEKITQHKLAYMLHISAFSVSGYEQDARSPSPETLIKIADLFHMSPDFLLGKEQ